MISIQGPHLSTALQGNNQLFFLGFLSLMALVCFWLIFHYLKRARLIEDTPTSKIRSAAQGYVEIVGTASYGDKNKELVAPLSGRTCVWYTYKIQRYRRSGKNSHWSTIEEDTSNQYFQIQDDTGNCVINPKGAEVITAHSRTWHGNTPRPGLIDNRPSLLKVFSSRRYRYIEKFIFAGDIIYALGYFKTSGGGRDIPSNHKMTGEVIKEWKQKYTEILNRFDRDKNGEIDLQEWESVRAAASQEAEKRRKILSERPTVHSLNMTTDRHHPFILSNFSQKTLTKRYRFYTFFSLIGMIACITFIVMYFLEF